MREIAAGEVHPNVIGLRHDVDNLIEPCLELAEWEHRHGYRSSYFILHDSPYWDDPQLPQILDAIAELGHEIGLHVNALAEAFRQGRDPFVILELALQRLRSWGHAITGVVAHGDPLCYGVNRELLFVNDELFSECARPTVGEPERVIERRGYGIALRPRSLESFGLRYEAYRTGARALYLSDSGGVWNEKFETIRDRFPHPTGQLHILQHPCWWLEAFPSVEARV